MDDNIKNHSDVRPVGLIDGPERMVTVAVAAELLGIAKNTLDKARVYGGPNAIPFAKLGKRVLYSTRDIALHIKSNTLTNTCQRGL